VAASREDSTMLDQMIKSWAHLPAYQRTVALESIRATAKAHRILVANMSGPGRAPRSRQHEARTDALGVDG